MAGSQRQMRNPGPSPEPTPSLFSADQQAYADQAAAGQQASQDAIKAGHNNTIGEFGDRSYT